MGNPGNLAARAPEPANPIVTALTAAGIKAHPHQNRHGDVGAILHMVRKGRYCQLVIIERGTNLFWQILDRFGHEPAFYRWDNTQVTDAPTRVRAHCRTFHARILPTRPVDAVPGQLLNP